MSIPLPRIRGMQVGLRRPELVDQIKADMLAGNFRYADSRLYGYRDASGTHYVHDGHHRMVAALEILRETGDDTFAQMLIAFGDWTFRHEGPPAGNRPMPSRSFWSWLRNRLGF